MLNRARKSVTEQLWAGPLGKAGGAVCLSLKKAPLAKAPDDDIDPDDIVANLDMSSLGALADDDTLSNLAVDAVKEALAGIGVNLSSNLVDQVNQRAVSAARDRAADLVSEITEATRNMIRDAIADGLDQNIGRDAIVHNIADGGAFDDDRAELIADTEIARANSTGALEGYKGARDSGVNVMKSWLLGSEACDDCRENADAGPIDLDDDFTSGDDAPPAHPNCRCALSPVVFVGSDAG